MTGNGRPELLIIGVYPQSDGYPNVRFRVAGLHRSARFHVTEINKPAWNKQLHQRRGMWRTAGKIFRGVHAHIAVLASYLTRRRPDCVYVPYPAVFVVLLLTMLPRRLQPGCIVVDAFISLYDTVVVDRKYLSASSWLGRILRALENRALGRADLVITDTPQNTRYLCQLFGLDSSKVKDLPLATDEQHFHLLPAPEPDGSCTVLFIGTFVPLHGVECILAAADDLHDRPDIRFRIIGDGQMSPLLEEFVRRHQHSLSWIRSWQSSAALAEEIAKADICLGIFGDTAKAQRVCPLKLYMYAACGKAILTADSHWARDAAATLGYAPFITSPVGNGLALADRIRELADSGELRRRLCVDSRRFYVETLSNQIGLKALETLIETAASGRATSVPTKQDHEFE
jgi:glycosyltransferase involved in cell wall biosynthesis